MFVYHRFVDEEIQTLKYSIIQGCEAGGFKIKVPQPKAKN